MCGSYIHGRSWRIAERNWEHFCQPYQINAHGDMPTKPTVTDGVFMMFSYPDKRYDRMHDRYTLEAVEEFAERHGLTRAVNEEHGLVHNALKRTFKGESSDWGIQPWDGRFAHQRGGDMDRDTRLLIEFNYLPATKSDLRRWAEAHWGKHGDEREFNREMPQCLDIKQLWPELPDSLRKKSAYGIALSGPDPDLAQEILDGNRSFLTPREVVAEAIENGGFDAFSRWRDMFNRAPNAFWAGRG